MKFLVTGGAGSVGRDLSALLAAKGHSVRVLDKQAFPDKRIESLQGRLEDKEVVERALQGIDTVIHLA